MGNYFGSLYKRWFGPFPVRIIMLGLDAVGKTTTLYKLNFKDEVTFTTIPTIGFNVETIVYKNIEFTMWDIGGGDKYPPLWRHYLENTQGVIYIVDSTDRMRLGETISNFIDYLVLNDDLKDAKFLILANKQDLPDAMSVDEISKKFLIRIPEQIHSNFFFQAASARTGAGLYEGLDWLSKEITPHN